MFALLINSKRKCSKFSQNKKNTKKKNFKLTEYQVGSMLGASMQVLHKNVNLWEVIKICVVIQAKLHTYIYIHIDM